MKARASVVNDFVALSRSLEENEHLSSQIRRHNFAAVREIDCPVAPTSSFRIRAQVLSTTVTRSTQTPSRSRQLLGSRRKG
jgi:hypothetical protein